MPESPRNLLLRNRHVRSACFLDLDVWNPAEPRTAAFLDRFAANSHARWGGLSSPLILHRANAVSEEDWALLRYSDPDQIQAVAPLSDGLLTRIDDELAPTQIDLARVYEDRADFDPTGIPILPTQEVMSSWRSGPLLIFDLLHGCDLVVRRFVERNFGAFEQWEDSRHPETVRRLQHVENLLQRIPVETVPISDRASLAAFLNLAAGSRPGRGIPYAAPRAFVALCELGGRRAPFSDLRGSIDRYYLVQVGDSPADFAIHWNTAWLSGNLGAQYKNQLWIPTALAQDPVLHDALNNWLRHYSGAGNSGSKAISFASESVESETLRQIGEAICRLPPYPLILHLPTREERAKDRGHILSDGYFPRMSGNEADVYRRVIYGTRGFVDLPFPTPFGIENPEGAWMVDVQVEQVAPGLANVDPFRPWLLPRSASRIAQHIFKAPARINRTSTFSVEVSYNSIGFGNRAKPNLRIQLPAESDVVRWVLTTERGNWRLTRDPRAMMAHPAPFLSEVRFSDKGRLMHGLLGLFGGLIDAQHYLSRPFWQKLFRDLAALDPKRDQNLITQTQKLLAKELRSAKVDATRLERVAERVAGLLSGRILGQYRTLRQCERLRLTLAKTEKRQGDFAAGSHHLIVFKMSPFSRSDLLTEFDELTTQRILRLGAALLCPRCGLTTWHGLAALEQPVRCPGCEHGITVPISQQWSVELNSLARMAVLQGVLGVIQALNGLGQLSESFFFMPSCDLFRPGDTRPWHEVDIVAVVNGELVLGEVKEGNVRPDDFESLCEVAEALRPARALFFTNQDKWPTTLNEPFETAKKRLAANGVVLDRHDLVIV